MLKCWVLLLTAGAMEAQTFHYLVAHGQLDVDASGVAFRADKARKSVMIPLADVFQADLSDPKAIRIETYGRRLSRRRSYTFRLLEGAHGDDLARFFVDHVAHPVQVSYSLPPAPTDTSIDVYHRHRLGGCGGKLTIGRESVRFVSSESHDSRTWLYRDLESIGEAGPLELRVTSLAETYHFDLKERLPQEAYDFVWSKLNYAAPR